mmetsp:Transcript_14731/g.39459  ORF Transcript_14731/g.39459 Transcript_14731/m.39459 type:complete len:100 (+) Transcript_14731:518-817(+)
MAKVRLARAVAKVKLCSVDVLYAPRAQWKRIEKSAVMRAAHVEVVISVATRVRNADRLARFLIESARHNNNSVIPERAIAVPRMLIHHIAIVPVTSCAF